MIDSAQKQQKYYEHKVSEYERMHVNAKNEHYRAFSHIATVALYIIPALACGFESLTTGC